MSVDKWDHRQLCSDGSCIGVIGPDGTCKMCGRAAPNWGDERKRGLIDTPDDADADARDDGAPAVERPVRRAAVAGGGGEWNHRQLCSDGACIGVLGSDGRCKLCGKQGDATAYADEDDENDDEASDADPTSAEGRDEPDDAEGDDDGEDAADPTGAEGDDDEGDGDEGDDDEGDDDEGDDDEGDDDESDDGDGDDDDEGDGDEGDDDSKGVAATVDDRRLCPDGACVGVIGPDGRCKICRKEAE